MIEYKQGSLFDAPKNVILAHATNPYGVFGAGIAKIFRERYPKSYLCYVDACQKQDMTGGLFVAPAEHGHLMACLFTSKGYGNGKSAERDILAFTRTSVDFLLKYASKYNLEIHSNKFNSGLFSVPWEKTEAILKELLDMEQYKGVEWVVWSLEE